MDSVPEDHRDNSDQHSKREENCAPETDAEDNRGYRTPTSEAHTIPETALPPPPPKRKRKRLAFDRTDYVKRVRIFKSIVSDSEIEAFFRTLAPPPQTDESTDRTETS